MGALDGIRVIDMGIIVQGPQAAALLHDLGAEVIKVELPGVGDQARAIPASDSCAESAYFLACNRGKRSVTLDVRVPAGREAFVRLCDRADVVVSNFMPGTMEAWGLGYDDLSARNPRIVFGTGSAFGPVGPDADREGADLAGQASGGLISTTGGHEGDPSPVGATIADHIASQHLAAGILAALFARERTGRGQQVDVSLLGGQIWAQASEYTSYFLSGQLPGRSRGGHPLINAAYGIFATTDGWIAVVGVPPKSRQRFAELVGLPELWSDRRFTSRFMTTDEKSELFRTLAPAFRTKSTAEWCEILRSGNLRYAAVRSYDEVAADPQVWENGYLIPGEHPVNGAMPLVGSPLRLSDTPARPGLVAPELGQHTEEVLLEHGFTWDDIAALRRAGAL